MTATLYGLPSKCAVTWNTTPDVPLRLRRDLLRALAAVGRVAARVLARIERHGRVADRAFEPPVARNRREPRRPALAAGPSREAAFLAFEPHDRNVSPGRVPAVYLFPGANCCRDLSCAWSAASWSV